MYRSADCSVHQLMHHRVINGCVDDDRSGANNRRNFVRFGVVSQMRFATGMAIAVLRGAQ